MPQAWVPTPKKPYHGFSRVVFIQHHQIKLNLVSLSPMNVCQGGLKDNQQE